MCRISAKVDGGICDTVGGIREFEGGVSESDCGICVQKQCIWKCADGLQK